MLKTDNRQQWASYCICCPHHHHHPPLVLLLNNTHHMRAALYEMHIFFLPSLSKNQEDVTPPQQILNPRLLSTFLWSGNFCKDKWSVVIWLEKLQSTPLASRMNTNMEIGSACSFITSLCLRHDGWVNNNILLSDQKCHHQQITGTVCGKSHSRIIVLLQWKKGFMRAVYQKVNSHRPCVILKTWGKGRQGSFEDKSPQFFYENFF